MSPMYRGTLTSRGAATKAKLLEAAAELMLSQGVAATTLDDTRERSGTSKSQLYAYFPDKQALVVEVARYRADQVLERERRQLDKVHTITGLERWHDTLVKRCSAPSGTYGCVLGSMANELSEHNQQARDILEETFESWRELLVDGLVRMQADGQLTSEANPQRLATLLISALQGAHVLSRVQQDAGPIRDALGEAIDHVRSFSASS